MRRVVQGQRGFSLLEFLVVTVILAIMAAFLIPLAAERLRMARVRTSVNQFTIDLRAARWAAVSSRQPVALTVAVHPDDRYVYTDLRGNVREIALPEGVRIVSSTNPIQFTPNGSVVGGSSTVFETEVVEGRVAQWTVTTNVLGVPLVELQQVGS